MTLTGRSARWFLSGILVGTSWLSAVAADEPGPLELAAAPEVTTPPVVPEQPATPVPDEYLTQFLQAHPEHPLGQWTTGMVWYENRWVPHWDVISQQENRYHEVHRYREQRARREDNFRDNLYLADGCREHGLRQEERAHLVRALLHDYSFHEAHLRLGHINIGQRWITPRDFEQAIRETREAVLNLQEWSKPIQQLHVRFARTRPGSKAEADIVAELQAIRTPAAIPALELHFASRGDREAAAYQHWLASIESHRAAHALCRQALYQSSAPLRTNAAKLLSARYYGEFVPYLIQGLTTQTTDFQLQSAQLLPSYFQENKFVDLTVRTTVDSYDSTLTVTEHDLAFTSPAFIAAWTVGIDPQSNLSFRYTAEAFYNADPQQTARMLALASATHSTQLVRAFGYQAGEQQQQLRVQRAQRALEIATDNPPLTREQWFTWWNEQQELALIGGKLQLNDNYDRGEWFVDRRRPAVGGVRVGGIAVVPPVAGSCFAAGTLVETEQGARPIEGLQVGDCVLSQDVETGELLFRPVLARTERKNAPMVLIKAGHEEIRCSTGHPFWVSGTGWRMAKELTPGLPLYTLTGKRIIVEEIQPLPDDTVYNLIVADFHTYFAGGQKLLTHDVSSRRPTDCVVPGVLREFQ